MLNKFWENEKNYAENHKVEMLRVVPQSSPNFNIYILRQNIDNINEMTDGELRMFIARSFKSILKNLFESPSESQKYVKTFQNRRFLEAMIDVVSSIGYIDKIDIIRCNTICYHYIILPEQWIDNLTGNVINKDHVVMNRMIELCSIINRDKLPRLLGLGLSSKLTNILVIARNSDLDLRVCVERVNFILLRQSKDIMTEEMLENIYMILYDIYSEFDRVFTYVMFDCVTNANDNNIDDIEIISSTLNLAILNIMQKHLDTKIIRAVLINYAEAKNIVYPNKPVRFSLSNLSGDYDRINDVINELAYDYQIYIP